MSGLSEMTVEVTRWGDKKSKIATFSVPNLPPQPAEGGILDIFTQEDRPQVPRHMADWFTGLDALTDAAPLFNPDPLPAGGLAGQKCGDETQLSRRRHHSRVDREEHAVGT